MGMISVDVAVVGLGTAGAALARAAARRGLKVIGLERRELSQAGAVWNNGVPAWCFEEAGLDLPTTPELCAASAPFHMVAGWGPEKVSLTGDGLLEVDMRALVARLQREAEQAGAQLRGNCAVQAVEVGALGAELRLEGGDRVACRYLVDAAGLAGIPGMAAPKVAREDLCAAAQEVRRVIDPVAASSFFERAGVGVGDTLVFTGVAGGYSIVNVRYEAHGPPGEPGPVVAILTGSIPALGHTPGPLLLSEFVGRNPWIGERLYGGARPIPLAAPLARLVDGPLVRLGDAGRMVFAAHGSGIGLQLLSATSLAATFADGLSLTEWNARWHERFGGAACSAVLFARLSRMFTPDDLRELFASGLVSAPMLQRGLLQQGMRPSPGELPGMVGNALRSPKVIARLMGTLTRMQAVELHHARVPRGFAFRAWEAVRERLLSAG
jgi:flavin-dependent dehydrogenase